MTDALVSRIIDAPDLPINRREFGDAPPSRMADHGLHAEARRRFQRSNPNMPIEVFDRWLDASVRAGCSIVLTLDGSMAVHPRAGP